MPQEFALCAWGNTSMIFQSATLLHYGMDTRAKPTETNKEGLSQQKVSSCVSIGNYLPVAACSIILATFSNPIFKNSINSSIFFSFQNCPATNPSRRPSNQSICSRWSPARPMSLSSLLLLPCAKTTFL